MTRLGVTRLTVGLLVVALAATACSRGDGGDISPAVVTIASGAPDTAAVTDQSYLVSGSGGVVVVDEDSSDVLYDAYAGSAVADGLGGLVFQRASGDRQEFGPGDSAILWVPTGEDTAQVLIEPLPEQSLKLVDVRAVDGDMVVFYVGLEGELEREGTLHRYDTASGETTDLGPVAGVESGATHSVGATVLLQGWIGAPDCGTRILDFSGAETMVAALPADFAVTGVCGEVPFRAAISADDRRLAFAELARDDSGTVTHTDVVVVDLDTGAELLRVNVRSEGVSWNIEDLDIGPDALIVNRWNITEYLINPLVISLSADDPVIVEAPAPGRAHWVDAPIEVTAPIDG